MSSLQLCPRAGHHREWPEETCYKLQLSKRYNVEAADVFNESILSQTSLKTWSSTFRSVPTTRAPAARLCPPPPNFWQIAQTSAASLLERMLTRTLPSVSSSKKTATITPRIARR